MMFRSVVAALLVVSATCHSISPRSAAGQRLLSKARRLNGDDDAWVNYGWAKDYSIKFHSCHTITSFRADGEGQEEGQSPTETQRLVHFKLCPSDTCAVSCSKGGDYLVDMREFVEVYMEAKAVDEENACQNIENNCYCDNANDDQVCLNQCYYDAGLDYCIEDENAEEEWDVDRFMECENIEGENDDGGNSLYAGAYCSGTGKGIYLGAFTDRDCTILADEGAYYRAMGSTLPYQTTSLVSSNCISCKEAQENNGDNNGDNNNNNNNNNADEDQVNEYCEQLYERSAKCEKKLPESTTLYPKNGGCEYIFKTLPRLERMGGDGPSWTTILMWSFFITTVAACAYAYFLWSKLRRREGINLNGGDRDRDHNHHGRRGKIFC